MSEAEMSVRVAGLMQSAMALSIRVELVRDQVGAGMAAELKAKGEVMANLSLALRHLEDADSRLLRAWSKLGGRKLPAEAGVPNGKLPVETGVPDKTS